MPIYTICSPELLRGDEGTPPWERTAEISRFAVSKTFLRRNKDAAKSTGGVEDGPKDPLGLIPNISLGLMSSIVAMAAEAGITHLYAVMEPALLRLLQRLGIYFNDLGPKVNYHGTRQPCFADLDALLARTWMERREVWEVLTQEGRLWPANKALAFTFQAAP